MEKLTAFIGSLALACGLALGQTESQQPSASGTEPAAKTQAPSSVTTRPSVMAVNVQHWRGTLMDANCAASGASASESQSKKGASCPVTSSTTMFAIQAGTGQVLKFDAIGNMRAAEELKNNKKWSREMSAGKPIHAGVSGNLVGDAITVTSIH
jgi:hypothetical protein